VTGQGKRGGAFAGSAAAIQLAPHSGSHLNSGTRGDLFVDHNTHLWFCRGGTTWVKLA
jgi:gas vesicle protein